MTRAVAHALVDEARRAHPLEACGLLLGGADGAVTAAFPCANVAANPARHFEIDPAALIAAHRAQRAGGAVVLGYYHSHPTGLCQPSPTDVASALRDGRIWAIVAGDTIGVWRDGDDGFEMLSTRLVEG